MKGLLSAAVDIQASWQIARGAIVIGDCDVIGSGLSDRNIGERDRSPMGTAKILDGEPTPAIVAGTYGCSTT